MTEPSIEFLPCELGVLVLVQRPGGEISTHQMTHEEFERLRAAVALDNTPIIPS